MTRARELKREADEHAAIQRYSAKQYATRSRRPSRQPTATGLTVWAQLTAGAPVETHRTVNATGTVTIAGKHHSAHRG